ncbi:MAG: cyclase family protein [Nitrosopumilaceae archaeon]|nr:cyclase family protein [Nitrosopumilaceae archaeon]NIU00849.1 cyclase family protein [Nitrosopumilaceae archaeon]NIU87302.1 cyclase family protein [Nitrosopumilaceae archaeon]NIV65830.1 cyclase family protein [Nitrosopumilaceae archaeon]NIX61451.1 cyclase family protein [Nitrosopumilaceae archaeon]
MKPIDLTIPISSNLPAFPGSPKPVFIPWENLQENGYNLELLFLSTHSGTHVDAPFHFDNLGKKLHEFPISRFCTQVTKIKAKTGKDKKITKEDIRDFERSYDDIRIGSSLIFQTDWDKKLKTEYYFKKNPGLTKDAAFYLISKKVRLVGIDSPSIDMANSSRFPVHNLFAKNNILIVENLTNLRSAPDIFTLIVLPLKLKGTTGSPVRAIAI